MSDAYSFAQQADLEIALGGANVLLQLSDPDGIGSPDAGRVTDYLESGAAEVRQALEIKHEPETIANLDGPSLRSLVDANAVLSARVAYEKGGRGLAMPPHLQERAERKDRFLEALANGTRRLGRVAGGNVAALGQPTGVVDYDPYGRGMSIRGLKRGFR